MNPIFINVAHPTWQIISMAIMLVPIIMIFIKQKGNNIHFQALAAVNILFFIASCCMNKFISLPSEMMTFIQGLVSLLHAPLGLFFLLHFSKKNSEKKAIQNVLILFSSIIVISVCFVSPSDQLILNLMLMGSLVVLIFSTSLFIQYTIDGVYENKDGDKAFLLSTIVFTYGTYFLLLMLNLISPEKHASDLQSLFAMINLLSGSLISIGIGMLYQPKKEIATDEECKPKKLDAGFAQWDNFNFY